MPEPPGINELVKQLVDGSVGEREQAVVLHNAVRDRVKFGFNKYFDTAEPEYTLTCGFGHCNPKSCLMVAFFRAAGLESCMHFVVILKDILKGAIPASRYWMMPAELSHSYVDVKVDGNWIAIDSFIIDSPLLQAGQARLLAEGLELGYGVRVDSTNSWDGRVDAFSQFSPNLMVEDHGRIYDLDEFFRSRKYRNQVFGLSFNRMFRFMGEAGVAAINTHIEGLRLTSHQASQEGAPLYTRGN